MPGILGRGSDCNPVIIIRREIANVFTTYRAVYGRGKCFAFCDIFTLSNKYKVPSLPGICFQSLPSPTCNVTYGACASLTSASIACEGRSSGAPEVKPLVDLRLDCCETWYVRDLCVT